MLATTCFRRIIVRCFVVTLFCLLFFQLSFSQSKKINCKGNIRDVSGYPISGVSVKEVPGKNLTIASKINYQIGINKNWIK
jgi:hypothetical protein